MLQKQKMTEFETKMSNLNADVFEKGQYIESNSFLIDELKKETEKFKDKLSEVITYDDLNSVREILDSKADRIELAKLYDLKSNKTELKSLVLSIDYIHKQIEYQAMLSVSMMNSMI